MRHKLLAVLSLTVSWALHTQFSTALAQGTAFTYQGQLNNGATPVNGSYDITFSLFNTSNGVTAAAGPVTETAVAVSNGLFTVLVDFGPAFTNGNAWLSVGVRSNGSGTFINLSPFQQITPTPYALEATSLVGGGGSLTGLNASQLTSGTVPVAQLPASVALLNATQTFTGTNTFSAVAYHNGGLSLNSPNGFSQTSQGAFSMDAPSFSGGRFIVTTNGNVGIGTANPATNLEVNGAAQIDGSAQIRGVATFTDGITLDSPNGFSQTSQGAFSIDAPSFSGGRFIVTTNGNVGIGTANPVTDLEVNGAARIDGTAQINGSAQIQGVATYTGGIVLNSANGFGQSSLGSFSIDAPSFSGGRFIVTTNGNVGIGTSNPATNLEVNGSAQIDGRAKCNGGIVISSTNGFSQSSLGSFSMDAPNISGGRFIVTTNGNVGIGTSAPNTEKLVVAGGVDLTTAATTSTGDSGLGLSFESYGGRIQSFQNKPLILNPIANNVGIGTTTPTAGLEVETSPTGTNHGTWGFYNASGFGGGGFSGSPNLAIYTSGNIGASTYYAFSDARIKNIIGVSSNPKDLAALRNIQVTDYTYKDKIAHGNGPVKKVIAQQVESVYPQAVTRTTGVIPDIYKPATVKDGWVQLDTNLKVDESVKLISDGGQGIYKVLETRKGEFRTDFNSQTDKVFVFGRQVDDFRNVDYEALTTLNISATQELARRLENVEAREAHLSELEQQAAEVTEMKQEMAEMKQMMTQLVRENKNGKLAESSTAPHPTPASLRKPLVTANLDQ